MVRQVYDRLEELERRVAEIEERLRSDRLYLWLTLALVGISLVMVLVRS